MPMGRMQYAPTCGNVIHGFRITFAFFDDLFCNDTFLEKTTSGYKFFVRIHVSFDVILGSFFALKNEKKNSFT